MNIIMRLEEERDFFQTENMTREAFWDLYKPGCDEHLLLHNIRTSNAFVRELDYVACDDDNIIGNIIYTRAVVRDDDNENIVLCMGPLCVIPSYQRNGVGTLLLNATIDLAQKLNYPAIVIYGNPDYYKRFGFVDASIYNVQTAGGENFPAFMIRSLNDERMRNIHGRFHEDAVFQIDAAELEDFDKLFPYKEKHVREGQLNF